MKNKDQNNKRDCLDTDRLRSQISALKKREAKLRKDLTALSESEKRYRTIFENTGTVTLIFDNDTIIKMVNSDFARFMGYSKNEVEGKMSWVDFIAQDDRELLLNRHQYRSRDPENAIRSYEFRVVRRDGSIRHMVMTIDMIPETTDRVASLIDITDKKLVEEEIMKAGEKERQKIGQDLHDDLTPHLIGIEALAKALYNRLSGNDGDSSELAEKIRTLVRDAVEKTRALARGLCPIHVAEHGLENSLKELAVFTEKIYGVHCGFSYNTPATDFDQDVSTNLYYIAQEAVHNAVKHGNVKTVEMSLMFSRMSTILTVIDDGKGFSPGESSSGMGIKIMKHRAHVIGASIDIHSKPKSGSKITVTLPVFSSKRRG